MNYKSLSAVALSVVCAVPAVSCSTTRERVIVTTCISDPLVESLHCVDPRGIEYTIPTRESGNYVCLPPDDFQKLFEESRRK